MLLKLAWRNMWRNRRRTMITLASVFFAVLLATTMRSLQRGVTVKMIENVVSFYTGYVQIHKSGYWDEPNLDNTFEQTSLITRVANSDPRVAKVAPRLESFALASSGEISEGCMIMGIDPENEDQLTGLKAKLIEGTYLQSHEKGAMITSGLAEKLQIKLGDTLILIGQGYQGISAAGKFPITGMVKFGNPDLNQKLVYLSIESAQNLYGAENRLTAFALNLSKPQTAPIVATALRTELDNDYEVMDWMEMMPEMAQLLEVDKAKGRMTMGILYMIIAFGMFGTVLMMTSERRHEFGVLMAIGMKKRILAGMVVTESILISMAGVVAGFIASLPIVFYFHFNPFRMSGKAAEAYAEFGMDPVMPMSIEPAIFYSQVLTVLAFAIIVAIYPAWSIVRTNPVEAMKS
ncbi:MAG: FtsX-like permease family protein [Bacteroidia bacterium]|nr:FtsX-like permease family protein [Bacteroidia bacterium]